MHCLELRAFVLLSVSFTLLTLLCAMTTFSDNLNSPSPSVDIQVMNIFWFQKSIQGDDEVNMMMLNITGNLESLFTWNTKQVFVFLAVEYETPRNSMNQISLWDVIIPSKKNAKFSIHTTNKYRFIDQGNNLRDKDYNLTLHWHVMPKIGKMLADHKIVKSSFRLPKEYK